MSDIADALANERRLADEAAATDDQPEKNLLIVLAKIAHKDRALVHELNKIVHLARAVPATHNPEVVAVIPFRIAAGARAAVNGS